MFFLIRCVFWLTIVFHAMSWPQETPSAQAGGSLQDGMIKAATGMAGDLATAAGSIVKAKLEEGCLKVPSDCVAAAAKLPQIVATAQAPAAPAVEVIPPKRPLQLAESESGRPVTTHKASVQHN
jgi:hypothetical protein